jgi:hypothetical protein
MVICLAPDDEASERCEVPLCPGCGAPLTFKATVDGKDLWRRACDCTFQIPSYRATPADLERFAGLLEERGLPSSVDFAQMQLDALADCRTRVEIRLSDGRYVVISAEQAVAAMAHAF